jgi:hypothetical protein
VDHDRCGGPSHHLVVLLPSARSCKTNRPLYC